MDALTILPKFREWMWQTCLAGNATLPVYTVKTVPMDLDDLGTAVTGATNATPIVVTAASHGFSNGQLVYGGNIGGNTAANGIFKAANVTTNTLELTDPSTGANVAGSGAYTSGGRVLNLSTIDFLDDIAAGIVGTAQSHVNGSYTLGVYDADNIAFGAQAGDTCEFFASYLEFSGAANSTRRVAFIHGKASSGLPVAPTNGINLNWSNGANKIAAIKD